MRSWLRDIARWGRGIVTVTAIAGSPLLVGCADTEADSDVASSEADQTQSPISVPTHLSLNATLPFSFTPDALGIDLEATVPDGARFDRGTKEFTWTPRLDQVGTHVVTFAALIGTRMKTARVEIEVVSTHYSRLPEGDYDFSGGDGVAQCFVKGHNPGGLRLTCVFDAIRVSPGGFEVEAAGTAVMRDDDAIPIDSMKSWMTGKLKSCAWQGARSKSCQDRHLGGTLKFFNFGPDERGRRAMSFSYDYGYRHDDRSGGNGRGFISLYDGE